MHGTYARYALTSVDVFKREIIGNQLELLVV
jgi:hypothetical protein